MELPRDTENLFPDDPEAQDLVDFLVNTCENQAFTAECAAASRDVQDKISENNDKYKGELRHHGNCFHVLCDEKSKLNFLEMMQLVSLLPEI